MTQFGKHKYRTKGLSLYFKFDIAVPQNNRRVKANSQVFLTVFIAEQGYCYPLHKALRYSDITKNSVPIILKTSLPTNNCIVHHQYKSTVPTAPLPLQLPTKIIYSRRRRQITLITNSSNFHLLPINTKHVISVFSTIMVQNKLLDRPRQRICQS